MNDQNTAHGVLFYAMSYTSFILLAVATLTGRVVFAILILLTCGLTVFVMNAIQTSTANLAATGKWFQSTFASALEKLKGLSSSSASPEREKVS